MRHPIETRGPAIGRFGAGLFALLGVALAGCVYAPPPDAGPPPGYGAPPPGYAPGPQAYGGPGPGGYGSPGPAGYGGPGPAAYGGPGQGAYAEGPPGAGITRPQFIEMARRGALRRGRDPERAAQIAERRFDMIDTNHDGLIEPQERAAWRAAHAGQAGQAQWQQPPGGAGYQGPPPRQGQWQGPPPGQGGYEEPPPGEAPPYQR